LGLHRREKIVPERYESIYNTTLKREAAEDTCCDESIVKLRDSLLEELADELMSSEMYDKAGFQMKDEAGLRELGDVLHKMSMQEYEHWVRLVGMVNVLNELCECGNPGD
jgi:hypothetical protein